MREFKMRVKRYTDPEEMAAAYLTAYFGNQKVEYPLNPFKMLKDEGIAFSFQNYHKLEGVYIPASAEDYIPVVGINAKRPVTRQRFTAAHELCHHFRDADKRIACPLDHKTGTEKFAESFAAAVLMPMAELRQQVKQRTEDRYIDFDAVLEIADYFGVSFESCLFRIAYNIHAIPGNTEWKNLKKRAKDYAPDKKRKDRHMSYAKLYADLFDCYSDALKYDPIDRAKYLFQSDYIYNDSRMEGLNITQEEAAEIVTDLRLNQQNSPYCTDDEKQEAFMSIAGHYRIYSEIFSEPLKDKCSVFETSGLNSRLFSYYPNPDYGGGFRQNNTMVLGAKFDTVDYNDIASEMLKLDAFVQNFYQNRNVLSVSEYIKKVAETHHRLTVIHAFPNGNGRTSRVFMNVLLVRAGITPLYIKVEEKNVYTDALAYADQTGRYDDLYEVIFKAILRCHADLMEGE